MRRFLAGPSVRLVERRPGGSPEPQHTHTSNLFHNVFGTDGNTASLGLASGTAPASSTVRTSATGITVNASTPADATAAHENMPPFLTVNWIIKY